jgi:hypothetical protein
MFSQKHTHKQGAKHTPSGTPQSSNETHWGINAINIKIVAVFIGPEMAIVLDFEAIAAVFVFG